MDLRFDENDDDDNSDIDLSSKSLRVTSDTTSELIRRIFFPAITLFIEMVELIKRVVVELLLSHKNCMSLGL